MWLIDLEALEAVILDFEKKEQKIIFQEMNKVQK